MGQSIPAFNVVTDTARLALESLWSIPCSMLYQWELKLETEAWNFWCLPPLPLPCIQFFPSPPLQLIAFLSFLALYFCLSWSTYGVFFPAFEVSNHTALLHLPGAGGEHLLSRWWLRLLECPWVCESHWRSQLGPHTLMYGESRQSGERRWMEQMVILVEGLKLFNPPPSKILIYLKMSLYFT